LNPRGGPLPASERGIRYPSVLLHDGIADEAAVLPASARADALEPVPGRLYRHRIDAERQRQRAVANVRRRHVRRQRACRIAPGHQIAPLDGGVHAEALQVAAKCGARGERARERVARDAGKRIHDQRLVGGQPEGEALDPSRIGALCRIGARGCEHRALPPARDRH
jgi:hypothetical protein